MLIDHQKGIDLIILYLKQRLFEHNGDIYEQTRGIPMGGKPSTYMANLYGLYHEYKSKKENTHLWITNIRLLKRYIDDIIIITRGNANTDMIIKKTYGESIRITKSDRDAETNDTIFLDIQIRNTHGQLLFQTYRKPGNAYNYPPKLSYLDNKDTKIGFIQAEIQRMIRTNNNINNTLKHIDFFISKLFIKGYNTSDIEKAIIQLMRPHKRSKGNINSAKEWHIIRYNHLIDKRKTKAIHENISFKSRKSIGDIIRKITLDAQ